MKKLSQLCSEAFDQIAKHLKGSDINRDDLRCFQKSVDTFLETGLKEDAFAVYFCFCDIFKIFGSGYDNVRNLLQLLSDHEYHSGELLAKHRDHYSHSAYVFALGLAIYSHDKVYRDTFCKFYGYPDVKAGYIEFLKYWGMTSLFHDVGYPFQLAHEQIKSYGEELWGKNKSNPYVSFGNIQEFLSMTDEEGQRFAGILNASMPLRSINEALALSVNLRMGYDISSLTELLYTRVVAQPNFMDHGYFGAVLIIKQLLQLPEFNWNVEMLDSVSAILLHNSLNKFDLKESHPVGLSEHPLAYLLMLCDELQNWDRLAYGKVSKKDPIAWDVRMDIRDNHIDIMYIFDSFVIQNLDNSSRLNKSHAEILDNSFVAKIVGGEANGKHHYGFISSQLTIAATSEEEKKVKKTSTFASDNNLINLYDFAVAIHASYTNLCSSSKDILNKLFADLPLEFKISNIQMAKSYAEKLEQINCFYSSRDLDYPVVEDFDIDEFGERTQDVEFLSRAEHVRWSKEKISLGWKYGQKSVDFTSIDDRNAKKLHNCLVPYELLSEEDKAKDILMIRNIIPMLRKVGGNLRVYRYLHGRKPELTVAGVGHIRLGSNKEDIKKEVTKILSDLNKRFTLTLRTSYAYGADQIIAECANDLNIPTKAILPMPYDEFLQYVRENAKINGIPYTDEDEMRLRLLLAQTVVYKHIPFGTENPFDKAAEYNIARADKLIAIWDGIELPLCDSNGKPINRGGTYDCICKARARGLTAPSDIYIIPTTPQRPSTANHEK